MKNFVFYIVFFYMYMVLSLDWILDPTT